jgi:hypothetical protein
MGARVLFNDQEYCAGDTAEAGSISFCTDVGLAKSSPQLARVYTLFSI